VRRLVLMLVLMCAVAMLACGVAFAVTKNCPGGGTCRGTNGADALRGSPQNDTLFGLGGNDRLVGLGGMDMLKGGTGADALYGGAGNDRPKGGSGSDRLYGDGGDDTVRAGTIEQANDGARDFLYCGEGQDTAYFTPGQDFVAANCELRNPPAPPAG
jgi:hypothetical protein